MGERDRHFVGDDFRHDQSDGLPGRDLIAEAMDRTAGQFDGKMIGAIALHEAGGGEQQLAIAGHIPRDVKAAGVRLRPSHRQDIAGPLRATLPRNFVQPSEIGPFGGVYRQLFAPRNEKSHQAHQPASLEAHQPKVGGPWYQQAVGAATKSLAVARRTARAAVR